MKRVAAVLSVLFGTAIVLVPLGDAGAQGGSPTFAGYTASFPAQAITFNVTFSVPRSTCLNKQGLDGYLATEADLIGTSAEGGVEDFISCTSTGKTTYQVSMTNSLGASVSEMVKPGDKLTYEAFVNATSETYSLTGTTSAPLTLSGPGFLVDGLDAGQVAQAGPFPQFHQVKFSNVVVNATPLSSWHPVGYDQVSGTILVQEVTPLEHHGEVFFVGYVSQY
ncbi:MAG TPA: hypothetical protein VK277_11080 [Acidimicrobiales bacterium]|nr:hypothetical protein [Acidimicrobiales bacterium]